MIIRYFHNPYYNSILNNYYKIVYEKEKPKFRYVRGKFYPLNDEALEIFNHTVQFSD